MANNGNRVTDFANPAFRIPLRGWLRRHRPRSQVLSAQIIERRSSISRGQPVEGGPCSIAQAGTSANRNWHVQTRGPHRNEIESCRRKTGRYSCGARSPVDLAFHAGLQYSALTERCSIIFFIDFVAIDTNGTNWSFQSMRVIPIGDKVVLQRVEPEETTAGGIVLPDTARERTQEGRILSVGDGRVLPDGRRSDFQVSEGDRVLFSSFAGTDIEVDGKELLIMSESDILAVVS